MVKNTLITKSKKIKVCGVEGCSHKSKALGLCPKHYDRLRRNRSRIGDCKDLFEHPLIKWNNVRENSNEIIMKKNICEILLVDINGLACGKAIIDAQDLQKVRQYYWTKSPTKHIHGYKNGRSGRKVALLHRVIMAPPKGLSVDHIDHDPMNNRKNNLRIATHQQNLSNLKVERINNTSGYKGVYQYKKTDRWRAGIKASGKSRHLGCFKYKEDAAKAYNKAAIKYFGEFACLNKIKEVSHV